eukprot:11197754-Lingulodinium_polyedra.AAC.1
MAGAFPARAPSASVSKPARADSRIQNSIKTPRAVSKPPAATGATRLNASLWNASCSTAQFRTGTRVVSARRTDWLRD